MCAFDAGARKDIMRAVLRALSNPLSEVRTISAREYRGESVTGPPPTRPGHRFAWSAQVSASKRPEGRRSVERRPSGVVRT
ncbi:hypothetical protein AB0N28_30560, partial [Streptomyces sp. NPDC051130]|uniref:hypothetical protein n=1 Tax=Streptomyces sp. NPDC051130 TaxID=3157223 RepID=UPI00342E112B